MNSPSPSLLDRFAEIVGAAHAVRDPHDIAPYLTEPREKFHGVTPLVLKPGSVAEVAAIMKLASETGTGIVPQGGNTGLVGGQIPSLAGNEVVLSLTRLKAVRAVDPDSNTMIVEAGVTLDEARAAADAADRLFPLKLASGGSCDIGGNVSTNAGGTEVLAYGNMRELVLGVEVVLPTGEVWDGLRTLRKDNTGYDLKHLFIGAEGTLGVVTAAVLTLMPKPAGVAVAFIGLKDPATALKLFHLARDRSGRSLTAFELLPRVGLEFVLAHAPGTRDPLAEPHPWYVLMEYSSARGQDDADAAAEAIFAAGLEAELVDDGALAQSLEQAEAFWHLRETMSEVQKLEGGSIKHDVAVPLARVPDLIERASAAVAEMIPGVRPCPFGHIGDGNIHLNFSQPVGADKAAFLARWEEVNARVHGIVGALGGTISAEHGIGVLKRAMLKQVKSPLEIEMMGRIKRAFDPAGILNPGKVL